MLKKIKKVANSIKVQYSLYDEDCYWENEELKYQESPKARAKHRSTWFGFIWHLAMDYLHEAYSEYIGSQICKYHGHKWEMEDTGNAESGPITYAWCKRCGHSTGPVFGM